MHSGTRVANFQKMKFGTRRQRRRDRDAEGVEGGLKWRGGIPSPATTGFGEASCAPPGVSEAQPQPKTNLGLIKHFRMPVVEGKSGIS